MLLLASTITPVKEDEDAPPPLPPPSAEVLVLASRTSRARERNFRNSALVLTLPPLNPSSSLFLDAFVATVLAASKSNCLRL